MEKWHARLESLLEDKRQILQLAKMVRAGASAFFRWTAQLSLLKTKLSKNLRNRLFSVVWCHALRTNAFASVCLISNWLIFKFRQFLVLNDRVVKIQGRSYIFVCAEPDDHILYAYWINRFYQRSTTYYYTGFPTNIQVKTSVFKSRQFFFGNASGWFFQLFTLLNGLVEFNLTVQHRQKCPVRNCDFWEK